MTSSVPVNLGTGVKLLIRATDLGSPITVHSTAIRWANHGEFRVEFLNLTALNRNRLNRFLHVATPRSSPQN